MAVINAYFDCNSPYSYFALIWLKRNRTVLAGHGVDIDIHPVLIGGINAGSGNKPPWTVPAKAALGKFDRARSEQYFGTRSMQPPDFFPVVTLLPMRSMLVIKDLFPKEQYERAFESLWEFYWQKHRDVSKVDVMRECLGQFFKPDEVADILQKATEPRYKKMLVDQTASVVKKGAYGCPWFIVKNKEGKEECFFGSDRFHHMLMFLGVPFSDITITPASGSRL